MIEGSIARSKWVIQSQEVVIGGVLDKEGGATLRWQIFFEKRSYGNPTADNGEQ